MIALVGYIILAIGFMAVALQKTFQSYNLKLEHLKDLIIELKDNKKQKKNKIKNKK